ncbi:MAG: alpha/beta hydrolase [Deltaproteobacteria bacterium]|nr:alpha/beta hydrolase [Deltaproteobacteria bacterium]
MRIPLSTVASMLLLAACSSAGDEGTTGPAPTPPVEGPPPSTTPPSATGAGFVAAPCRFAVPKSVEGKAFRCGDLVVPENREDTASRTIKVHVIVFKGKEGGVPTIELNGGPGGSSEMIAQAMSIGAPFIQKEYGRFLESGDLVLFDQRGTGRSLPRLSCDVGMGDRDPVAKCKSQLTGEGIALQGYVTAESADDVHDLVKALGVAKVNLHGISYGTRLALEILRRHPDDVNATVIDGVVPGQAKLLGDGTPNLDALVTHVFAACAADAKCNATYPNLDATLTALKTKLETTPFASKLGGAYDWYAFQGEWFQRLYGEGEAGKLPFVIHDLSKKTQARFEADEAKMLEDEEKAWREMNAELFAGPLGREVETRIAADADFDQVTGDMPLGMYMSVVCSDHGQYESLEEALAADAKVRPELRDPDSLRAQFEDCAAWPKHARTPYGLQPITSSKPVLVIGGEVDPATPLAWAKTAASSLSASQLVEMKGGAHGAMDECAVGMKLSFLQSGKPVDSSCTQPRKLEFFYESAPSFHSRRPSISKDTLTAHILRGGAPRDLSLRALRGDRARRSRARW